jgi:hypothetical protein
MLCGVLFAAPIPLLASGIAFGGYVHHINIHLPLTARYTKQSLDHFARRVPRETRVEIKSMWFLPWPVTKEVWFEDLRRLPERWRLANLENLPLSQRRMHRESYAWLGWGVRVFMGRYWVSRAQLKDRSRAPGAWDAMWEQIPVEGEEGNDGVKKEGRGEGRVPYAIANRPGGDAGSRTWDNSRPTPPGASTSVKSK